MHKIIFIMVLFGLSAADCEQDFESYCNETLCPSGVKHIACGNSGEFYSSCPEDCKLIHLSKKETQLIVKSHNALRNKIASGNEAGFLPAVRMAAMTWSSELAKLAELNVKQCKMSHDSCHTTSEFLFAGQNLGLRSSTGDFEPVESVFENIIEAWYDEVKDASQSDIDKCCNSSSGEPIGHFTLVVTDRATEVGCAIATYTDGKWKTSLMACNYSFTNLVNAKVYTTGDAASGCTTGVNENFAALCTIDEPIEAKP